MYMTHRTVGSVVPQQRMAATRCTDDASMQREARVRHRAARGAASTPERLSSEVAKYGPPSEGSGMLLLEGSGTYSARPRVVTRCGGARPSWGPHPGLPWSQRPLQEDLSRYAENQPYCRVYCIISVSTQCGATLLIIIIIETERPHGAIDHARTPWRM